MQQIYFKRMSKEGKETILFSLAFPILSSNPTWQLFGKLLQSSKITYM